LLASANLLSTSLIVEISSSLSLFERVDLVKWIAVGLFLGLAGIHFCFFVRGDGIAHLVTEFEEDSPMLSAKGDAIFRVYVFGSVSVFVALILSIAAYRSHFAS